MFMIPLPKADSLPLAWFNAVTKYVRKRVRSLSPSSSESQVILQSSWLSFSNSALKLFIHSATKVVFPNPAGAESRVSLRSKPSFKRLIRSARWTSSALVGGMKSLVTKIEVAMLHYNNLDRNQQVTSILFLTRGYLMILGIL